MSAAHSIYIDAPVKKVFDFCKDPAKSWSAMPDRMLKIGKQTDAKMTAEGVGTYESWTLNLAGLRLEGFDVVTEFVPNKRITSRSSRSSVGTWTYTFEPEGSGTRLTMQRHPVSFWARRPFDRITERLMASTWQETLEKLKATLETATEPAAKPVAPTRRTR